MTASTTLEIPTIAVFPEENLTLDQKVEKWVWHLCRSLEQNYELRYPNSSDPVTFSMESGRKYWKINQMVVVFMLSLIRKQVKFTNLLHGVGLLRLFVMI